MDMDKAAVNNCIYNSMAHNIKFDQIHLLVSLAGPGFSSALLSVWQVSKNEAGILGLLFFYFAWLVRRAGRSREAKKLVRKFTVGFHR